MVDISTALEEVMSQAASSTVLLSMASVQSEALRTAETAARIAGMWEADLAGQTISCCQKGLKWLRKRALSPSSWTSGQRMAAGSRWRSPAQNASLFEDLGENRIDFKRRANWQLGLVAHVWDSKCVQGSDSACDRVPWFRL